MESTRCNRNQRTAQNNREAGATSEVKRRGGRRKYGRNERRKGREEGRKGRRKNIWEETGKEGRNEEGRKEGETMKMMRRDEEVGRVSEIKRGEALKSKMNCHSISLLLRQLPRHSCPSSFLPQHTHGAFRRVQVRISFPPPFFLGVPFSFHKRDGHPLPSFMPPFT